MKKILLTLVGLFMVMSMPAQNILVDFTTAEKAAADATYPITFTLNDVQVTLPDNKSYIFTDAYGNYKDENGQNKSVNVLFFKPGGKAILTVNQPVTKIIVKSTAGMGTNAAQKIKIYAGETVVEERLYNAKSTEYTFALSTEAAAGTAFTFENSGTSKNIQIESITFVMPTSEPALTADSKSLSFATVLNGTKTAIAKVISENVTGDITVSSSNAAFVPEKTTCTVEEAAAGINITYTGTTAGSVEGMITFEAGILKAEIAVKAYTAAHEGTEANPLSVDDVLGMNNADKGPYYVTGKIGPKTCGNAVNGMITEVVGDNVNTNMILMDGDKMIGVALPTGDTRTMLNIVDNEGNIGQTVIINGTLEAYFGAPGVKNTTYTSGLSGIENVAVDSENAPVEYYNLQGVRVENPSHGLYIKRQAGKAVKVIM